MEKQNYSYKFLWKIKITYQLHFPWVVTDVYLGKCCQNENPELKVEKKKTPYNLLTISFMTLSFIIT